MLIVNASPRTAGKTTDTAWLGHALQEHGFDVEGFDADHSKQFWDWSKAGKFAFPVHLKASARFHDEVELPAEKTSLVDCGHSENHPAIADTVFRVADLVILHMSPTRADWLRVAKPQEATPFKDIVLRSAVFRAGKKPPTHGCCSTGAPRAVSGTRTSTEATTARRDDQGGIHVFTTVIPSVGLFGRLMELPGGRGEGTAFGALVVEMKEQRAAAVGVNYRSSGRRRSGPSGRAWRPRPPRRSRAEVDGSAGAGADAVPSRHRGERRPGAAGRSRRSPTGPSRSPRI